MSPLDRSALPNVITLTRIALTPVIFYLILVPNAGPRMLGFLLFALAAFSDLWDGYLARKHGWITDFGKLIDPIADKLLLIASFIPLYIVSNRFGPTGELPVWNVLPLWVLIVVFGREVLITALRARAARRGIVIPAGQSGKYKAFFQNLFSGSAILWYAFQTAALEQGWHGTFWNGWQIFHGTVTSTTLAIAVALTLYSLADYLKSWQTMERAAR